MVDLARHAPRGGWSQHVLLFQRAVDTLARGRHLSKDGWRVMAYLLGRLDWDNWLVIPQWQIVKALDMHQPNVSRAIRQLCAEGVLMQAAPPAPRTAYRLSADFAYRGQYNGWQKRRREEQAEREAQRPSAAIDQGACPLCGAVDTLHQDAEGRWGCVACDQWVETLCRTNRSM